VLARRAWHTWGVIKILGILAGCLCVSAGFAFWNKPDAPTTFDLTFSATGLVEQVEVTGKGCTVKVAVYDWINLSQGFELSEIPGRSDRYYLHGVGEACQALTVAMASTEQHIGFEVGRSGKNWYFTSNPAAAAACGGMKINWLPDPES
jgi:hypothetical protein